MSMRKENQAVALVLAANLFWSFYPIFAHQFGQSIPPVFFAAVSILIASLFSLAYLLFRGGLRPILKKDVQSDLWLLTIFIIVIPSILFFIGAKGSSGVNASFLLLFELIFTVIFTHFIGERTTALKLLGSGGILLGAVFIVYDGTLSLNLFDLLIILSTVTFPFGNFYGKRALLKVSPEAILFFRTFFGGLILLLISLIFERPQETTLLWQNFWWVFLLSGLLTGFLSKVFWYHALKSLDISKAIALSMTFPLFSLILLIAFFKEPITIYQWLGMGVMMVGVYFTVIRPSVDPRLTRYYD